MDRRTLLKMAGASALATPAIVRAAGERVLKFIPQSDLAVLDPVWTSATVTRNHAYLVFDTLYARTAASRRSRRWSPGTRWRMTADSGR
jgi:peptide/nickel transport system substrate-binding protein